MDKSYRIELKYQHHGGVLIFNYLWNGPQTPLRRLYGPLAADCAHRRPLGQIGSWWAWSGLLHSSGCRRCNSDDRWWENSKVSRFCTSLRLEPMALGLQLKWSANFPINRGGTSQSIAIDGGSRQQRHWTSFCELLEYRTSALEVI